FYRWCQGRRFKCCCLYRNTCAKTTRNSPVIRCHASASKKHLAATELRFSHAGTNRGHRAHPCLRHNARAPITLPLSPRPDRSWPGWGGGASPCGFPGGGGSLAGGGAVRQFSLGQAGLLATGDKLAG